MAKTAKTKTPAKKTAGNKRSFVKVTAGFEYWKPEKKGDSTEGTFVEFMKRENRFDKTKPQVQAVLKNDNGDQIMLPSHAIINNTIEKAEAENENGYYRVTCTALSVPAKIVKGKTVGKASPYLYEIEVAD